MLHHSFGGAVFFLSLQHFIAPALDLMTYLQARVTRDWDKGIFHLKTLFQKLWPLLYKRAELDLRPTKCLAITKMLNANKRTWITFETYEHNLNTNTNAQ